MFSHRLPWSVSTNRISERLAALRLSGAPLWDLTSSNPTAVQFEYPHEAIRDAFAAVQDFSYEPEPAGAQKAREAVAAYYQRRGATVEPERIFLTASTSEAYALLFKLFCDPGDEVLVPHPSYPLFEYLAALESVKITPFWLRFDGSWYIDFESLQKALTEKTRAIVIVNPNNPTGSFLTRAELERLTEFAGEHQLPLIVDEVFADYALTESQNRVTTFVNRHDVLSVSLNGLSKIAGMPQVKLGWIVLNGPPKQRGFVSQNLELILDTYLSVGTPVQRALPELFSVGEKFQEKIKARCRENVSTLKNTLRNSSAHLLSIEGGWSAIVQLPRTRTEEEWVLHLLEKYQTVVQPGYFFDMPSEAYVVVSLLTEPAAFREGCERIRQALIPNEIEMEPRA